MGIHDEVFPGSLRMALRRTERHEAGSQPLSLTFFNRLYVPFDHEKRQRHRSNQRTNSHQSQAFIFVEVQDNDLARDGDQRYFQDNLDMYDITDQVGFDREGEAAASRFTYFTNYTYEWDVTALVQRWVTNPASNNGVLLVGHPIDQEMRFRSSEWHVLEQRPKLQVVFASP